MSTTQSDAPEKKRFSLSKLTVYLGSAALLLGGVAIGFAGGALLGSGDAATPQPADDGFAQARPQLEQQLIQEREREAFSNHLDQLRADGDIQTYPERIDGGDAGTVIAVVNGSDILLADYQPLEAQQIQAMTSQGLDPDSEEMREMIDQQRPQLIDHFITRTLLMQQVAQEGITIGDDQIDEQIAVYSQQFGSEEALYEQLDQVGLSREQFYAEIREELAVQEYIEAFLDTALSDADLEFSEEELREMYEMQQQMQQQQMQQQMPQQP
ncbi:SurA N-terminal domain-containing protein [Spirochaeta africana]|uniref:SurA-like protein n=1 Tax=Spirochaeta africana (strain ATCC 700263 / DSM 8902 / Z-7692) TaxID=889378 RepID=H9ULS8_SPIAZ|nr:SurA N-terminal domain-containing protein [Spirochaeta africana]AFG38471.1 SurA-like protein [Spirochaeta africana DSM 8902]